MTEYEACARLRESWKRWRLILELPAAGQPPLYLLDSCPPVTVLLINPLYWMGLDETDYDPRLLDSAVWGGDETGQ